MRFSKAIAAMMGTTLTLSPSILKRVSSALMGWRRVLSGLSNHCLSRQEQPRVRQFSRRSFRRSDLPKSLIRELHRLSVAQHTTKKHNGENNGSNQIERRRMD